MIEIERKFLVKKEEWQLFLKSNKLENSYDCITQAYFPLNNDFSQRVRVINNKAYLTIKADKDDMSRFEFEYEIPLSEAWKIMDIFCDRILSKLRYTVIFEGKKWEVDEYLDRHEGLIIAEIELNSEDESFIKPPFIGEEVTTRSDYRNDILAFPYKKYSFFTNNLK